MSLLSSEADPPLSTLVSLFHSRLLVYILDFCLVLWVPVSSGSSTDLIRSWEGFICIAGPFSSSRFDIIHMLSS